MLNEFQHINNTLKKLDKMQASHIKSFDTELMPDLELQLIERNEGFNKLKQSVKKFIDDAGLDNNADKESMAAVFIGHISTLISQNKVLEAKVRVHRDGLKASMKKILRGKQVIDSYGSPSSVLNRPRAINLTN